MLENISGVRPREREAVLREGRYLIKQIELATSEAREMPELERATLSGKLDGVLDALGGEIGGGIGGKTTDQPERPMEELIDELKLARMLGVSVALLAKWRRKGGGPAFIQVAKTSVCYAASDVQKWIEERKLTKKGQPAPKG